MATYRLKLTVPPFQSNNGEGKNPDVHFGPNRITKGG